MEGPGEFLNLYEKVENFSPSSLSPKMENKEESQKKKRGREETLQKWVDNRKRKRELEEELEKLRKRIKDQERKNPWLGNIKGMFKQETGGGQEKKEKTAEPMETEESPKKKKKKEYEGLSFTPEEKKQHKRKCDLENKKKQLNAKGKQLPSQEEDELRKLQREDEQRLLKKREERERRSGGVNLFGSPSPSTSAGGSASVTQGLKLPWQK